MALKKVLTFAALLAFASLAWGQVTITQGSLAPIGTTFTTYNMWDVATFDVGSPGANQTWTFAEYTFSSSGNGEVLDPATTPYAADFPTANWALGGDESAITYYRMTSNAAYWLGMGDNSGSTVFDEEALVWPFPCHLNSQWTSVIHYEVEFDTGMTLVHTDSILSTADGWGTLQTQFGNHAVLRVFSHSYMFSQLTGFPPIESEYVGYVWYTAGGQNVVSVSSDDGVTDPNFTEGFLSMSDLTVPAEPVRGPVAQNFAVGQNYPNPFNPTTLLPVELERNARVTVKIYDETGRLVSQEDFNLPVGQHQLPINGSNWSTGTYFANVSAGADQQTVKMQLVK